MLPGPPGATVEVMITIRLDTTPPPTGWVVTAEGGAPLPFDGWLQLLAILNDVLVPKGPEGEQGEVAGRPSRGPPPAGPDASSRPASPWRSPDDA
jgi:hypothetical protein